MIEFASKKRVTLSSDEVQSFISEMNDDEFDDIELIAAALSSIS